MSEALAILSAAGLPARGAITLALFDRTDIVVEWSGLGLAAFLEGLVAALPNELEHLVGSGCDRVDPRWGRLMARLVAQRLADHIGDVRDREERLGDARSMAMRDTS